MSTKLSPLSPQISEGDDQIQVCLCPSAACAAMGGARVTLFNPKVKMSWGKFKELSVTSATSGPTVTFTGGNVCRGVCVWGCGGVGVWAGCGVCVCGGGGGGCVCGGVGVGVGVCVGGWVGGCGCMHVCVCTYVHAYVQCMCTCV